MFKTVVNMLVGAFIVAAVGTAFAVVGTPPIAGPALQDGVWLNGLAGGQNYFYQSNVVALGTNQATSTQLSNGIRLFEIATSSASTGVALPPCVAGTAVSIYNNSGQTMVIYPAIANNALTAAQDTINSGTTFSGNLANHVAFFAFCPKNGDWAAK